MKRILFMSMIAAPLFATACVSGPGRAYDEPGSAGLSLQLEGLDAGEIYVSHDGYVLSFHQFALAFSGASLGELRVEQGFNADIFEEEASDLVEFEDLIPGDYDEVTLTLGLAEFGQETRFFQTPSSFKNVESSQEILGGLSVYLEVDAVRGTDRCRLEVALSQDGNVIKVDAGDHGIQVEAGGESEILVEIDPNRVFSNIDLTDLCRNDAVVEISDTENVEMADEIAANLSGSFSLGEGGGHSHEH